MDPSCGHAPAPRLATTWVGGGEGHATLVAEGADPQALWYTTWEAQLGPLRLAWTQGPDRVGDDGRLVVVASVPAEPSGSWSTEDAPVHLVSGSVDPDAFGMSLDAGDLDGDGRADLAIGAPNDSRSAPYAGSLTIVYGGGW